MTDQTLTPVQTHLTRMLAGEAPPAHNDPTMPALLDSLRRTVRDRRALEELGRLALAQLNAGLHSSVQAEKAVHSARGGARG